ncbi:MAG: M6 family metalloprotease domain-containing protein [Bacteroidales bacterium]|nr:M6 family metalloprotease domain-containing protein [Bacteroidales bacterium]
MKRIFQILLTVVCVIVSLSALADPATSKLLTKRQSDGRMLSFYLYGDERLSFAKTSDGYTLLAKQDGDFYYAKKDAAGNLVASSLLACDKEYRTNEEIQFLDKTGKDLQFSRQQILKTKDLIDPPKDGYPTTGQNPLLVILVDFPDREFTYTQQNFQDIMSLNGYSDNNATGSVKDYYYDNSFGQLELMPKVVGPVRMSHDMAYYGAKGVSFVDCNPKEMISEACKGVDDIIDFNDYDINQDGVIDAVHVIFAGQGESSTGETNAIWPHRWSIYDNDTVEKYFDGVRLKDYSCSGEKSAYGGIDGIGTICHEFGHVLGLPDYYDADYGESGGNATALASWSIMASGSYNNAGNTPPIFNTNERMRMKWMSPDTLSVAGNYDLYPLIDSNKAYILTTGEDDDYYLIENRSLSSWDAYLPNKGMLIYHIKAGSDHCVNCDPKFQRCDIVEADNDDSQGSLASDVFTHESVNHYFTSYGQPYCFRWSDGAKIDKPITRIEMDSLGVVHFRYMIPDTNAIVKTLNDYTKNSSVSFTLRGLSIYDGVEQNLTKGVLVSENNSFDNAVFIAAGSFDSDTFFCQVDNLEYSSTYYYKAAAISDKGDTVYGDYNSFQTSTGLPSVFATVKNTDIEQVTISLMKTAEGDKPIKQYGIVYNTEGKPDTNSQKVVFDGDFDNVLITVADLEQATKYYFRAFALTDIGIKYGSVISAVTGFVPVENNTLDYEIEPTCPFVLKTVLSTDDVTGGAGEFKYLWEQSNDNKNWEEAKGINTQRDYTVDSLAFTTYFRRIVFSRNIKDTSNTVTAPVNASVGGRIYGKDTVYTNTSDTLILRGFRGKILSWQQQISNDWVVIDGYSDTNRMPKEYTKEEIFTVRVEVKNSDCPSAYSDTLTVTVIDESGLNYAENDRTVSVVPNPAKDFITVTCGGQVINTYAVYSSDGKMVMYANNLSAKELTLNTENLPDGHYFIKLNNRLTEEFIVVK